MKHYKLILAISILAFLFVSCKKDVTTDPNNTEYETDLQQFEAVWNGFNTAYVLWSIDTTDWDAIYERYHPVFAEMDEKPWEDWYKAWEEITSTLIDHHLTISLHRPSQGNQTFFAQPGYNEVRSRSYYHQNKQSNEYRMMLKRYADVGRLTDPYNVYSDFNNENCYSGVFDGSIAYIHISSFYKINLDSINAFLHFKQLLANNSIKAAIIDVRDNYGGDSKNLERELACFTSQPVLAGYQRTKMGLGRYDHSPTVPVYAYPNKVTHCQDRNVPVVILTNINSASMSEATAVAFQSLPKGYVVGERTFGAFCPLRDDFELFQSGTFGVNGEGHLIKTAKFLYSTPDGRCLEGVGVTPDKECFFDQSSWNNSVDNQLECAVEFAKEIMNQ